MDARNDTGQAAREFFQKRTEWIDYLMTNRKIGHVEFRIACFIAKRMNGDDQACWWSVKAIAKELGVSTKSVSATTAKLESLDLLICHRPKRGGNCYYLRMPYTRRT